jgi:hypothetical protein
LALVGILRYYKLGLENTKSEYFIDGYYVSKNLIFRKLLLLDISLFQCIEIIIKLISTRVEAIPIFEISGKRILFIHVPKTGGTSLSAALEKVGSITFDRGFRENKKIVSERHAHEALIHSNIINTRFDYVFMIIRDPVDRIISEYRYQCRKPGLHRSKVMGFGLWLDYSLYRAKKNRGYRDNHFRPQSEFATLGCEIFRFEDGLKFAINRINQKLGLSIELPSKRMNVSPKYDIKIKKLHIEKIHSFYASDYLAYNYDLEKSHH